MFADRVKETSITTGTGTLNLLGAATGFRTFVAGIGSTKQCWYMISDGIGGWEVGIGTVTSGSPDTLARNTVLYSSNSNALVNFSAGTKTVVCVHPADAGRFIGVGEVPTTAGSATVQTATYSPAPRVLRAGMMFNLKAGFTNTGAFTLNINGIGAIAVKRGPTLADPLAGDIQASDIMELLYDGTRFILLSSTADGSSIGAWTSVASAATTNIGAVNSQNVLITGTTTITAFDSVADGVTRNVRFGGALTLTHNATTLQLPGLANIVTVAGDRAVFTSTGGGNWICTNYERANGLKISNTNVVSGASAINFGQTNLNYYEEGTWTPSDQSGAGLTFTVTNARYTRIGRICHVECFLNFPTTASGLGAIIGGLPFTANGFGTGVISCSVSGINALARFDAGQSRFAVMNPAGAANILNSALSTGYIIFTGTYHI